MKPLFLCLFLFSCASNQCYKQAEDKRESKIEKYRYDLFSNEITFSEFEELVRSALSLEEMQKKYCGGK